MTKVRVTCPSCKGEPQTLLGRSFCFSCMEHGTVVISESEDPEPIEPPVSRSDAAWYVCVGLVNGLIAGLVLGTVVNG